MPRWPWIANWTRRRHRSSASPARRTTWKGSMTAVASASSSAVAVLKPVKPSIATTSTAFRQASSRSASQYLNACLERPSTMSSSRAGPVPSRTAVRSTITVTNLSPRRVWRHTCSSTPIAVTPSKRFSSLISTRLPSARTASLAVFHATPSPSATPTTVKCWHTIASSAHRSPRRDSFARDFRLGAAMHNRSRTPDLVSPSQRSSSRSHSDRSTAHPIAQVKHPVALNDYVWAFQQVLRVDGAEVTLAGPEHDGCDVHAYLVDPTCGERLAADVASSELDSAVIRKLPRLDHGRLDAVDKVDRRLGVPALGRTTVAHHDHVVDPTRRRPTPAVGDVEGVTAGNGHPALVPVRPDVVERSLRHLQNATVVQRHVPADEPLEDRTGIVVLSRDETIHRNRRVHNHFPHGFLLCLESQVLCGVSCRSCTKSIGWERPAVQDVVGMIARESPPDFGVPGRRETGEVPELAHEVGLVEVARASGNVSPV